MAPAAQKEDGSLIVPRHGRTSWKRAAPVGAARE